MFRGSRRKWAGPRSLIAASVAFFCAGRTAQAQADDGARQLAMLSDSSTSVERLRDLSIEQLAQIQVTSVAKRPETLSEAPASIYVISALDIARSGATSLPDILRLAPNLQISQTSAGHYVVAARGLNGNPNDQSFSNTLLVLIDGRSVYTPLFSGVYWDMQDAPPDDIERIEVISGPGATLWGANAVNGVINIITKKAKDTQGALVDFTSGSLGRTGTIQWGGSLGETLAFRAYARTSSDYDTVTATGTKANDELTRSQGGFRLDWRATPADEMTLQGDAYEGSEAQDGAPDEQISGRNLTGRWTHGWQDGGALQLQAYFDRAARSTLSDGGGLRVDTFDVDLQDSFAHGRHEIVVGGGFRLDRYRIDGVPGLQFQPSRGDLDLSNIFAQDSVRLSPRTTLVVGLKLENDPYSGLEALPTARLSWQASPDALVWAAVSRAIRSPTPFDTDVVEKLGSITYLTGNPNFLPETLTAYEAGVRVQPVSRLSASISSFYNMYDNLRSVGTAADGFIPFTWANGIRGDTWGFESWASYQVTSWWRLTASFSLLREQFGFKPGASTLLGVQQIGDDPKQRASLTSSMNLGRHLSLETDLRYADALPSPSVPAYVEMNSRLAWHVTPRIEVAVTGENLLHARHLEYPGPPSDAVRRGVTGELRLHF